MMLVARMDNQITCHYPENGRDNYQLGEILTSLLAEVVQVTGVSHDELFTPTRLRRIAIARHLFCFIARKNIQLFSLREISDVFGIDHSTVSHACRNIENMLQLTDYVSQMVQLQYLEILGFDFCNLKIES